MQAGIARNHFDFVTLVHKTDWRRIRSLSNMNLTIALFGADGGQVPGFGSRRINAAQEDDRASQGVGGWIDDWQVRVGPLLALL